MTILGLHRGTQKNGKLHGKPIKELRKGTGLLCRHLKTCNPDLWRKLRLSSKHSKAYLDEEGEEIEVSVERFGPTCTIVPLTLNLTSVVCSLPQLMSFKECLPSHVRFVEDCFLSWEVFYNTRSRSLKAWMRTLNKRAGLPHRATCMKSMCLHTTCRAELSRAGLDLGNGSSGAARKRAAPEWSPWCMGS